jgi:enoyl-CoA hydratase
MDGRFDYECESFSALEEEGLAVFRLNSCLLDLGLNLDDKGAFFRRLRRAEESPAIRALVLITCPSVSEEEAYGRFVAELSRAGAGRGAEAMGSLDSERMANREENAVIQLIMAIDGCATVTLIGLHGHVGGPLFGLSLCFDLRIAASDTILSLAQTRAGTPPGGGLGFFLPRYVGLGRAKEMVLSGASIDMAAARQLGLVSAICPGDHFAEGVVEKAREMALAEADVAHPISLMHPYRSADLEQHLMEEADIMARAWLHMGAPLRRWVGEP